LRWRNDRAVVSCHPLFHRVPEPVKEEWLDNLAAVRVLQVDDCGQWRRFVEAELQARSVQVIGTAADGWEAVQKARALKPDVILMDIWMPRLNGVAATREIGRLAPQAKVLIVSNERDPAIVQAAFAAGARGYVLKSLASIELLTAVEAIICGGLFIGRGLTQGDGENPHHEG
jgi:DNA-binding NarL/FixJ family response regulator